MKSKILAAFLVVSMGCVMLGGCGSKSASSDNAKQDVVEVKDEAEAVSGEQSLTVWAWDKSFNIYAMEEAEKVYQAEHPEVSIDIVEVGWDDMQIRLRYRLRNADAGGTDHNDSHSHRILRIAEELCGRYYRSGKISNVEEQSKH